MKKIIMLTLILFSIIILISCNKSNIEANSYESQISNLESKLTDSENEKESLQNIIDGFTNTETTVENEETSIDIVIEDKNDWINNNAWDEIIIYNNGNYNKTYKSYNEEEFTNIMPINIVGELEIVQEAENNTDIKLFDYSYIFKKDNISYRIDVINEYRIAIDGILYKTSLKATSLGNSLINHTVIYEADKPLDKIYSSTFSIRKKYFSLVIYPDGTYTRSKNYNYEYYLDGNLIKNLCIAALKASQKMDNSPLLSNNINSYPLGEFKTYYQSEVFSMDVYYSYIHIYKYDNSVNIWYGMAQGKEDLFNELIAPLIK